MRYSRIENMRCLYNFGPSFLECHEVLFKLLGHENVKWLEIFNDIVILIKSWRMRLQTVGMHEKTKECVMLLRKTKKKKLQSRKWRRQTPDSSLCMSVNLLTAVYASIFCCWQYICNHWRYSYIWQWRILQKFLGQFHLSFAWRITGISVHIAKESR